MSKLICILSLMLQIVLFSPMAHSADEGDELYRTFGERAGLVKLMDSFMDGLLADTRMAPFFRNAKHDQVKKQLVDQFCELIGGPCEYAGEDMKSIHLNLAITAGDFNALVEVLQMAMDQQGIKFSDQNRLLAKLAPMHRAIITPRGAGG